MLERQVVIPASQDQLWDALTEPASLSAWFGSQVAWDLRPGGEARFDDADGTSRRGVIDAVLPGKHLSFRWWRDDETEIGASRVTYELEPDEDGTRLIVTEQRVPECRSSTPAPASPPKSAPARTATEAAPGDRTRAEDATEAAPGDRTQAEDATAAAPGDQAQAASASAAPGDCGHASARADGLTPGAVTWTAWDSRLFRYWALAMAPARAGRGIA